MPMRAGPQGMSYVKPLEYTVSIKKTTDLYKLSLNKRNIFCYKLTGKTGEISPSDDSKNHMTLLFTAVTTVSRFTIAQDCQIIKNEILLFFIPIFYFL